MATNGEHSEESPPPQDEFPLAREEGLSPRDRELLTRVYPPVPEPPGVDNSAWQFSLRQIMVWTFIASIGLAGGSWASAQNYAGTLGFFWLLLWLVRPLYKPDVPYFDTFFFSVGLAYGFAAFRAVIVSWFMPSP